jgi:lanosterol synthase
VCFTYGTWFGVEGLIEAGESPSSPHIRRACQFLLSKQMSDGGWGESFQSCVTKQYVQHEHSQVINTAWAVMTLIKARCDDTDAITRGVQLILRRQQDNGDWLQEGISGI